MLLPYGRLLHPRPALTNCKSCRIIIENCHRMHTRHKHTTSAWRNTHTSHTRALTELHASQYKQKTHIHHTRYTNIQHTSKPQCQKNTIFDNDRYTTNIHRPPHSHYYTQNHTCAMYCLVSSSEEILSRLTRHTLAQLRTNKSPFLKSYLHKVDAKSQTSHDAPSVILT